MPTVTVQIGEGRTAKQKLALIERVTQSLVETIGVPAQAVTVFIQEYRSENHGQGGKNHRPRLDD